MKITHQLALPPAKETPQLALPAARVPLPISKNINDHTLFHKTELPQKQENSLPSIFDFSLEQNCYQDIKNRNRNKLETNKTTSNGFCYHAGILIFTPYLDKLKKSGLGVCTALVIQLLVSVLLGAKNIEQTKLLNFKSLKILLGDYIVRNLHTQRKNLKQFSTDENTDKLLAFNAELISANKARDFYYDPHTKHYTGLRKILKSWCSKVRMADKVVNTDFIHTTDGLPVYLNNGDTFEDMRVRFFKDVVRFRETANIAADTTITMCIDRGIFSGEVFEQVVNTENLHIVTWEKGYKNDRWNSELPIHNGQIIKVRNNKQDKKLIKYQYQEYNWNKNLKIRQIIVRLPEKNAIGTIELSILSDDFKRSAILIINLIFNRWIQENSFKYMIAHFGLDQITSYSYFDYQEIQDDVQDKQHVGGKYKSLTKELNKIRGKLRTCLHKKHSLDLKFGVYEDISALTEQLTNEPTKELIQQFTQELSKSKTFNTNKKPTKKQKESYIKNLTLIVELNNKNYDKFTERKNIDKYVSKKEELAENNIKKLDTSQKQFMDIIKITAHNIFLLAFKPFKEKYNNYRDDHLIFREITRSSGIVKINDINGLEITVNLFPKVEIYPKERKILQEIFNEINDKEVLACENLNSKRKLRIDKEINSFFAF